MPQSIISKVENFVREMFKVQLPENFFFHNIKHTEIVVKAATEIGIASDLSVEEIEIVTIASWFHDVGYCFAYNGHEEASMETAEKALNEFNYAPEKTRQVRSCIAATRGSQNPVSLVEMVICDADHYHLSLEEYPWFAQQRRLEFEYKLKETFTDEEWLDKNCAFLMSHCYYTAYGKRILQFNKARNIRLMNCKTGD